MSNTDIIARMTTVSLELRFNDAAPSQQSFTNRWQLDTGTLTAASQEKIDNRRLLDVFQERRDNRRRTMLEQIVIVSVASGDEATRLQVINGVVYS
jgi:hypothetical protein